MRKSGLLLAPVFALLAALAILWLLRPARDVQAAAIALRGPSQAQPTPVSPPAQPAFLGPRNTTTQPGVYVFYDWRHLKPADYPIVGGHVVVLWNALQPGENTYNWNALDSWINVESALNKPFGLGLDTYEGACCGGVGVPDYVFQRHPSAKVVCPDGEVIPKYWDPGYQEEYRRFIQTFGQRYDGDPRIAFLQIGVGVFGETQPAYDAYDKCLSNAGLTSAMWVEFVEWTIDTYRQALPNTPLVLEFVPRFMSTQRAPPRHGLRGTAGGWVAAQRVASRR